MGKFYAGGTGVTFGGQKVANLLDIDGPDESREDIDATDHDSEGNVETLPGLRDGGSLTLNGYTNFEDAGQLALRTSYEADSADAVEETVITYPNGHTFTFDAFVTGISTGAPHNGMATTDYTIRITGSVTHDTPAA